MLNLDMSAHIERDLRLHSWEADAHVESRVRDEQARLVWSQTPSMLGLGAATGLALVVAQWPVIDHLTLSLWAAALAAVSAAWAVPAWRYRRAPPAPGGGSLWIRRAAACAGAYGLAWAGAGLLLFPDPAPAHQAILTVLLAGVATGAVATLSSTSATGILVIVPVLVPLAYRYALLQGSSALLVLGVLLVLLLTLVLANRYLYETLRDALRQRIEKSFSEAALHESEARYRLLFRHLPLGIVHYDQEGTVLDCNPMTTEILGTERKAVVGHNLLADDEDRELAAAVGQSLESGWGYYENHYEWPGGTRRVMLRAFFNGVERQDTSVMGGVGILEDFTARKRTEEATRRQAYYDALTDLPNRRLLDDRLHRALATAQRHGRVGALVFLDVDYFKRVNDWLGHASGDEVLRVVARRLQSALRGEDTAARLSGDEFILLLPELGSSRRAAERGAHAVCAKLQRLLQEPIAMDGNELRISVSVGITLFPNADAGAAELLRRSDTAMYRVKRAVRGDIHFYDAQAGDASEEQPELEQELSFALEREELFVEYQPLVDTSGGVCGAETLLRWNHPRRGRIEPDRFVPIAEETGLIIETGRWTLAQACRCLARIDAATLPRLSVNVSAREFHHRDFVGHVRRCLEAHGVDPSRLVIEVTENVLIDQLDTIVRKMHELRGLGVCFEVDDFGTGYSSLTYLKQLPVQGVKIDRSFVRELDRDANDAAIVEAIAAMAHRLGLYVVAEGVEREGQLAILRRHGCDRYQGYHCGEPAAFDRFVSALGAPTARQPALSRPKAGVG